MPETSGQMPPPKEAVSSGSFFRLKMVFEPHGIGIPADFESEKERMKSEMAGFFVPNQENVCMMESANLLQREFDQRTAYFAEGVFLYGSFAKANIYATCRSQIVDSAQKIQGLRENFDDIYSNLVAHPDSQTRYKHALYSALDELAAEGYQIRIDHEPPVSRKTRGFYDLMKLQEKEMSPEVVQEGINIVDEVIEAAKERNGNIARYIQDTSEIAESSKRHTNLLMFMGSDHIALVDLLPEEIRKEAQVVDRETKPPKPGIISRLLRRHR